jgi:hypothetical protein
MDKMPKEKAIALTDKYLGTIIFNIRQNIKADCIEAAKKSALICVDEIIDQFGNYISIPKGTKYVKYWDEVKKEINNL